MTPAQKAAVLQIAESLVISALITGLWAIVPLVAGGSALDWRTIGMTFGLAALFSLAHGAVAYAKSYNTNLDTALEMIVDSLEQRIQKSAPPAPPVHPGSPLVGVYAAPTPAPTTQEASEKPPTTLP